jgi:tRNA 2-thiouridine synthesizing protein A
VPDIAVKVKVDCRGMHCPAHVVMMRRNLSQIGVGDVMEIIATDPATEKDIPPASRSMGLEVLTQEVIDKPYVSDTGAKYDREYHYYLRKNE